MQFRFVVYIAMYFPGVKRNCCFARWVNNGRFKIIFFRREPRNSFLRLKRYIRNYGFSQAMQYPIKFRTDIDAKLPIISLKNASSFQRFIGISTSFHTSNETNFIFYGYPNLIGAYNIIRRRTPIRANKPNLNFDYFSVRLNK